MGPGWPSRDEELGSTESLAAIVRNSLSNFVVTS